MSHWEVKRRLRDEYNKKLVALGQGYKANRRPNYCKIYDIVDIDTNEIDLHRVTIDSIVKVLFKEEPKNYLDDCFVEED